MLPKSQKKQGFTLLLNHTRLDFRVLGTVCGAVARETGAWFSGKREGRKKNGEIRTDFADSVRDLGRSEERTLIRMMRR